MKTYSIRMRAELAHPEQRDLIDMIMDGLYEQFAPVDSGGSYTDGIFDIWVTVLADDEAAASRAAQSALAAAAIAADKDLATRAGYRPPYTGDWLGVKDVNATEVVLTSGDIDLLRI